MRASSGEFACEGHGEVVRLSPGDPPRHLPRTAEPPAAAPRLVSARAPRVRRRRDDLIPRLEQLAYTLRWSWDPAPRDLFQSLAPEPWARTHTPLAALKAAIDEPDRL